jgi:hypothetical protein
VTGDVVIDQLLAWLMGQGEPEGSHTPGQNPLLVPYL